MDRISGVLLDFVASNLRSQLGRLNNILDNIERENNINTEYATESISEIETDLRQIKNILTAIK